MASAFALIIGQDGAIQQIIGRAAPFIGVTEQQLIGTHVMRLFHPRSQSQIASLVRLAPLEANLELGELSVNHASGTGYLNFEAHSHATGNGQWRLDFDRPDQEEAPTPAVLSGPDYLDRLAASLGGRAVRHKHLMLLDIAALRQSQDNGLQHAMEVEMQDHALKGQIGRLGNGTYGVLPDSKLAAADLTPALYRISHAAGIMTPGIQTHTADISDGPVNPALLRKALGHLMHRFLTAFDKSGLPASLRAVGREMDENFAIVRAALAEGRIGLRRQAVIDLSTGNRHMEFVLGHLLLDGSATLAANLLLLDDHPELALSHDLGMAELTIQHVAASSAETPDAMILEISASSLVDRRFEPEINTLLARHALPVGLLGFALPTLELGRRGAPEQSALVRLLHGGHPIWLTQFAVAVGSAAAIQGLGGAFVEAPGKYLHRMCESQDGRALIQQLVKRWRDANVHIVASGGDDDQLRRFLLQLGIRFGLQAAA